MDQGMSMPCWQLRKH